jgi:hypothetical protein
MNNHERRSYITLIAINVLLDPDTATVEKAQAVNARLQQRIIDAVAPFAVEQGTGEAFAPASTARQSASRPWTT